MRLRISVGIGVWMVGATTAATLSSVALSHLGTTDPPGSLVPTVSAEQVKQALAAMTGTAASSAAPDPVATQPTPSRGPATAATTRQPSWTGTSPSPASGDTAAGPPVERWLSVDGGAVAAQCRDSTVFLSSWSPAQGYQVGSVQRGPASSASVVFVGNGNSVTADVACSDGVPSLTAGDEAGASDQ